VGDDRSRELGRSFDLAYDEVTSGSTSAIESVFRRKKYCGQLIRRQSLIVSCASAVLAGHAQIVFAEDRRIEELESQLRAAQARVSELEQTLTQLASELTALKATKQEGGETASRRRTAAPARARSEDASESVDEQRMAILVPNLGDDERDHDLTARPALFLQTGFAAEPISGATPDDAETNFTVNRLESRWAGRVAERLGLGFEIQYSPAAEGASEELVNDAFVEYYADDALTVRVGQFVKPFGFDVQHSSSERESPERAMFAGYFFPGQRDRGAMVAADLGKWRSRLDGLSIYGGLFNGNRFFSDNNDALNVDIRIRKQFASRPFAIGASWEHGSQLLPPGVAGSDRSDVYGFDAQWAFGPLGIRAEYVRGDTPSTLLSLQPVFAPGFEPGRKTRGATAFFDYRLTSNDQVYWRWDRLTNDPVTNENVRAVNVGYLRRLGESSRIGFDYQWKNTVTFNDDELNTHFAIRWNISY
jgi:hypothetical protein